MSGLLWVLDLVAVVLLAVVFGLVVVNVVLVASGALMTAVLRLLPPSPRRPPPVPGCGQMNARRVVRLWQWNLGGYRYGTTRGSRKRRLIARGLVLGWWASAPGLLALQFWMATRRSTRYYLDPADTAVLAISGHRNRWSIGDHASAEPGTKQGRMLRKLLLPTLTTYADAHGIAITTSAAVPALAAGYAEDLPGLRDVGRALPRGRKMRREPIRQIHLPHDLQPADVEPSAGSDPFRED